MNFDAMVAPGRIAEAEGPVMKALEASAFLPVVPGGLLGRAMRRVDDLPEAGGLLRMGDSTPARVPGQVDTGMSGTWYSRLESAIESAPQPRATGAQWRGMIRKGQGGVGKTEMEWTGIERALEDLGDMVLTKEEVLGMARERPVGLSEEVFGASTGGYDEAVAHADRNRFYSGKGDMPDDEWRALSDRVRSYDDVDNAPGASFSKWTQGEWGLNPEANSREIRVTLDGSDYVPSSTHNTPAGELVRIRTTDRQVNGDRTLFLEEIQSDWHQKGRSQGYQGSIPRRQGPRPYSEMDMARALERQEDAYRELDDHVGRYYGDQDPGVNRAERQVELSEERDAARAAYTEMLDANREWRGPQIDTGVPDAPFKKTEEWVALSLRRALQEAAEGGYDRLAWVSGEQAADLYDLRKQVSRVEYIPDEGRLMAFDLDGTRRVIDERGVAPEQLPDYIGKDPAQRLIESVPEPTTAVARVGIDEDDFAEVVAERLATDLGGSPLDYSIEVGVDQNDPGVLRAWYGDLDMGTPGDYSRIDPSIQRNSVSIEGDGLAVGGEGMNTFYDRIVPNVVKKEARRLGVEIEPVRVAEVITPEIRSAREAVNSATTPAERRAAGAELMRLNAGRPDPTNLSIRITPEARRKILKEGTKLAGFGGIGLLGANFARQQRERAAEQNNSRGLLN